MSGPTVDKTPMNGPTVDKAPGQAARAKSSGHSRHSGATPSTTPGSRRRHWHPHHHVTADGAAPSGGAPPSPPAPAPVAVSPAAAPAEGKDAAAPAAPAEGKDAAAPAAAPAEGKDTAPRYIPKGADRHARMLDGLAHFYMQHAPDHVLNAQMLLDKFHGSERFLHEKLKEKYGVGPVPPSCARALAPRPPHPHAHGLAHVRARARHARHARTEAT